MERVPLGVGELCLGFADNREQRRLRPVATGVLQQRAKFSKVVVVGVRANDLDASPA